jgi:hypothetical protein
MSTLKNELWMKASVAGSLWAAFEIVAGSFLHNLYIPFTGTIMAAIGVTLLAAFSALWKTNGLIIRAGLVCALMKSISPSAMILGPMMGIMIEALLMQAMVSIAGKNLAGYLLGGIMAMLSLLVHKAIGMLLSYGFDAVQILENMVAFALKMLSMPNVAPIFVLYYYTGLLILLGMGTSLFGYYLGNKARTLQSTEQVYQIDRKQSPKTYELTKSRGVGFLIGILVLVVLCLFIISTCNTTTAIVASASFIASAATFYPKSLKPLCRPVVWANLLIILIITSFFYDYRSTGVSWSYTGWMAGIKMVSRAFIVLIGFAIISIELRNPIVELFLSNKGASQVYQAVQTGFSILPSMIASLPSAREMYTKPIRTLTERIAEVDLLIKIKTHNEEKQQ